MTQTIDHKIGALLVDFSGLSPNDAMAFIKILNRSNKMSKLLLDYVSLDEQEAAAFVAHPPVESDLRRAIEFIRDHWQRRYGLVQVG